MPGKRKDGWELWDRVKETTVPLNSTRVRLNFDPDEALSEKFTGSAVQRSAASMVYRPHVQKPKITTDLAVGLKLLDQPTNRKIAKGKLPIDGKLDLHGLTQEQAHSRLHLFIENAYMSGKRTLLVITGKGPRSEGVLKTSVPRWLSDPKFRNYVIGSSQAHVSHGGSGALYVRIKNRTKLRKK